MAKLDIENLLKEISAESPSGADLSYDAAFQELERLAKGKPEQQVGTTITPAEEPAWRDVNDRAVELFSRTKHLRVALFLTVAQLKTEGLPGLRDGLIVLRGLVEKYWDTVHPRLDPEDNNDPTERVNIIASIAAPAGTLDDPMMFAKRIREAPLTNSKQLGRLCLRDVLIAKGELPVPAVGAGGMPPPDGAMVDGAFEDTPTEDLQANFQAAEEAVTQVRAIAKAMDERVGVGKSVSLATFEAAVREASKHLQNYLARRGYGTPGGQAPQPAGAPVGGGGRAGGSPLTGEIQSVSDVLLALDKVCRYYEKAEVSSPVPLMVKMAQRMVSKSFLEITRVLTPDAIRMIEEISGLKKE
jgi:type VI secretion system protein ImpA